MFGNSLVMKKLFRGGVVKKSLLFLVSICSLCATLILPPVSPAQQEKSKHHRYKLIDMGTFGGPSSLFSNPDSRVINNRGTATGVADTSIPDPNCFFDCLVDHAFVWKNGVTADLGTLQGGMSSIALWVNNRGLIVGQSQNASIDPLTGAPEVRGVLWRQGQIIDLSTLGGNASTSISINDHGQVLGAATNATLDPFANAPQSACLVLPTNNPCSGSTFGFNSIFSPTTTETHAFIWQDGLMRDIGTLGGPDSAPEVNNDRGEVTGWSYTSFVANPSTGTPNVDPFLWSSEDGTMTDLGSLGGTFGAPFWLNNQGQVVGASNLAGDQTFHPFLWSRGKLNDLGTLGGYTGVAFMLNDAGEAVGYADLVPNPVGCSGLACIHHASLWKDGVATDLGTLGNGTCSRALAINQDGQIVGATAPCGGEFTHAFLWENGGPVVDVDSLVLNLSGLTVREADFINDRGEIAGRAVLPNSDVHAVLLIPCDEGHLGVEGCDYDLVDTAAVLSSTAPIASAATTQVGLKPSEGKDGIRSLLAGGHHKSRALPQK
jgi:probable HAF family extracellular repeat protein